MIYLFLLLSLAGIFGRFLNFYLSKKMHSFTVNRRDWKFFMEKDKFYMGLTEEVFLSGIIAILFPLLPFLAFGWFYSTFQDALISVLYPEKRFLRSFHKNQCLRGLIKDFVVPYVLVGFALSFFGDIYSTGLIFLGLDMTLLTKQIMEYY